MCAVAAREHAQTRTATSGRRWRDYCGGAARSRRWWCEKERIKGLGRMSRPRGSSPLPGIGSRRDGEWALMRGRSSGVEQQWRPAVERPIWPGSGSNGHGMGRRRWRERLCGSGRGEIKRSGEERPGGRRRRQLGARLSSIARTKERRWGNQSWPLERRRSLRWGRGHRHGDAWRL